MTLRSRDLPSCEVRLGMNAQTATTLREYIGRAQAHMETLDGLLQQREQ